MHDPMNETLRQEMVAAGYVISPNNIHALPGVLMYPDGRGRFAVPEGHEVQVLHDRIRVFRTQFFGEHYSRKSYWDTITVAVFESVPDFRAWCEAGGAEKPTSSST